MVSGTKIESIDECFVPPCGNRNDVRFGELIKDSSEMEITRIGYTLNSLFQKYTLRIKHHLQVWVALCFRIIPNSSNNIFPILYNLPHQRVHIPESLDQKQCRSNKGI